MVQALMALLFALGWSVVIATLASRRKRSVYGWWRGSTLAVAAVAIGSFSLAALIGPEFVAIAWALTVAAAAATLAALLMTGR